jgi:hypothetical protein
MQWVKNWRHRPAPTKTGSRTSSGRASFKPQVELLDERQLLSTCGPISSITKWGWAGATTAYEIYGKTVYRTDYDGAVVLNATHSLGGPSVLKVSAGLDAQFNPEVFAIATDYTVWLNDSAGWHWEYQPTVAGLNGIIEISGTVSNYAYALDGNHRIWMLDPTSNFNTWTEGDGYALHIAAQNRDYVYGIDPQSQQVFQEVDGWSVAWLGGPQVIQISTASGGALWAIDTNHNLRRWTGWPTPTWWDNMGGYCLDISANASFVYAIGSDHALYKYDPNGTFYEPAGWQPGYGTPNNGSTYVTDISAPDGTYYNGLQVAGVDECYGEMHGTMWFPLPSGLQRVTYYGYWHHTWWGWQIL